MQQLSRFFQPTQRNYTNANDIRKALGARGQKLAAKDAFYAAQCFVGGVISELDCPEHLISLYNYLSFLKVLCAQDTLSV